MTSWSDALPELRAGDWTRRGGTSVLGDAVTEGIMGDLAEATRAAARAQGYAVGWAEGRREAAAGAAVHAADLASSHEAEQVRRDDEHAAALAALAAATQEARTAYLAAEEHVVGQATELAHALLLALVEREVADDAAAVTVRRALAAVATLDAGDGAPGVVRVRVHPAVAGSAAAAAVPAVLVADPALAPGDAVAETDVALVDARLSRALERVAEALR